MEVKKYAPVIIPTLNRYEHFKRCLESLEKCTGSQYTEVYVGIDYPPSEKYKEGWEKICEYLASKEKEHCFKKLHVIKRAKNCGVGHPRSNGNLLVSLIKENYESYIFTEDDNEFSPNYLEYINKCLQRFKDDNRILKVCGYNFVMDFPSSYKNNFYFSKSGCAWGTGSWTEKQNKLAEYESFEKLTNIIRDETLYNLLLDRYPRGITLIHSMLKLKKLHGDAIWEIYCALEDKYFILPIVSKVRNFGNDGTGVHSLKEDVSQNKFYSEQTIDESDTFDFTDDIFTYEPVYLKRNNYKTKITLRNIYKSLVVVLDIWLLRKFNYMPKLKYI